MAEPAAPAAAPEAEPPKMSREEQIGFHKGSVDTLLKERNELVRIVGIVDTLLKAHLQALQQLGVALTKREEEAEKKSIEEEL